MRRRRRSERSCRALESFSGQSTMRLTVDSSNLIEALNRVIASLDGTLPRIQKERGTVASFELERSAYEALKAHLLTILQWRLPVIS